MPDNSALLIAIAGFGLVCAGTLFILLLIILRVTGRNAWTFLTFLIRGAAQDKEEDDRPIYVPRHRPDLKQLAESVDFETAVARNVIEQEEFGANDTPRSRPDADSAPPAATPRLDRAQGSSSGDAQRRRRRNEYDQDEVFGGLLDDDGDGSVDY